MMQKHWYRSSYTIVTFFLLPLSWFFHLLVVLRRKLYAAKIKKSFRFPVPVIVVGNITVGGTGKTPFVIWLANYLQKQGWQPGIVSRGVGGEQTQSPNFVTENSDPKIVGDEAVLLAKKTQCPLVIAIDRVAAVKKLLSETHCDVVISDDGLQHYRLARDIEIAMLDGARSLGNKALLPAGPLREAPQRLKTVDFVIENTSLKKSSVDFFTMQLYGDQLFSLQAPDQKVFLNDWQGKKIHAVAAIGNPERFFESLRRLGLEVIEHVFPDHYLYQASDLNFQDHLPVIMTEKDAVKCYNFANERFWYLPVEAQVDKDLAQKISLMLKNIQEELLCVK